MKRSHAAPFESAAMLKSTLWYSSLLLTILVGSLLLLTDASAQDRIPDYRPGSPATATPLVDVIQDGGFEAGTPNAFWTEASTNFGTPICDLACGVAGQRTGTFWAWFGGIPAVEEASVDQDVILDIGTASLTFWLEVSAPCDSPADYIEVLVDGIQEFVVDGTSGLCGVAGYAQQTVDLNAYADGGTHNIMIHSEIFATNGAFTNFFVDDVVLDNVPDTAVNPGVDGTPGTHNLSTIYPNPFNPQAQFTLEVAEQQNVNIAVFDALGRQVAMLHDGALGAGTIHEFQIDGADLPSGVYVVRAIGEHFTDVRQVTLTK